MMKPNHYKAFLMLPFCFIFASYATAQEIPGDTIYVDVSNVVAIMFPAPPDKAELITSTGQDGLYEVKDMAKTSLSIKALKKDAADQFLEVSEGGRKHLFILSYKEGSPARSIDLSSRKKLSKRIDEKRMNVSKA